MQAKRLIIPCLLLVLILVTMACGKGGAPDPTATPSVPLVGRVLLLGNGDGDSRAIFEIKEGMQSPQLVWTIPEGKLEAGSRITPIIIPSPNHHYAMVVTNHTNFVIIDLTNGKAYSIDLPEREYSPDTYDITGTFSPDGRYLAYALTGAGATYSGFISV